MKRAILSSAMSMAALLALGCAQAGSPVLAEAGRAVTPSAAAANHGAGIEENGNPEKGAAMQWTTYTDPAFGFSLSYPDSYAILPERERLARIAPHLLGRCRFLEHDLARSEFAEMEPPKFSVEIYANPAGQSLQGWIQEHAPGGDLEDIVLDTRNCLQLSLRAQMAPNQFVFCAYDERIYKFTPMGTSSREMLNSFKFSP